MLHMGKRNQSKKQGDSPPSQPSRTGENLNVWVRADLVKALRRWLGKVRPRVTKTAAIEEALEAFLREKGEWPPNESPPDE